MNEKLPQIGDVLVSKEFVGLVFQHEDSSMFPVPVGKMSPAKKKKYEIRTRYLTEDERVQMAMESGKMPPKTVDEIVGEKVMDVAARFVVEEAKMDGGGTGHGPHDIFPDGWCVIARQLDADGTYNPSNPKISFFMSGCFTGLIKPEAVTIVDHMTMTRTFQSKGKR